MFCFGALRRSVGAMYKTNTGSHPHSHGTSEFYRARAAITRRLIEEHGFNTVAIEADWPDCRVIDDYVRQHPRRARGVPIRVFDHFPRWMWRNAEMQEFVDWLRAHNADRPLGDRVSFNGLDLYSMGASTRAVVEYLERVGLFSFSYLFFLFALCCNVMYAIYFFFYLRNMYLSTGSDGPRPCKGR